LFNRRNGVDELARRGSCNFTPRRVSLPAREAPPSGQSAKWHSWRSSLRSPPPPAKNNVDVFAKSCPVCQPAQPSCRALVGGVQLRIVAPVRHLPHGHLHDLPVLAWPRVAGVAGDAVERGPANCSTFWRRCRNMWTSVLQFRKSFTPQLLPHMF
jgi:hypothetical protein